MFIQTGANRAIEKSDELEADSDSEMILLGTNQATTGRTGRKSQRGLEPYHYLIFSLILALLGSASAYFIWGKSAEQVAETNAAQSSDIAVESAIEIQQDNKNSTKSLPADNSQKLSPPQKSPVDAVSALTAWSSANIAFLDPGNSLVGLQIHMSRKSSGLKSNGISPSVVKIELLETLRNSAGLLKLLGSFPGAIHCQNLVSPDLQFKVVGIAKGTQLGPILDFLRNKKVDIVADRPTLASQLSILKTEENVPMDLSQEIADIYQPTKRMGYQFEQLDFVTFRLLDSQLPILGIFVEADEDSLTYLDVNNQTISVNRSEILPGTLLRANETEILRSLNELNFIDYCTLNIAFHLDQYSDSIVSHRRNILLYPRFEIPEIREVVKPEFMDWRNKTSDNEVDAYLGFGVLAYNFISLTSHYADQRRFDRQTANRHSAQMALSDELNLYRNKLAGFGFDVCSNDYLNNMTKHFKDDQLNPQRILTDDPESLLREYKATHIVTIQHVQDSHRYGVNSQITLSRLSPDDGKLVTLWSIKKPLDLIPNLNFRNQYVLNSGRVVRLQPPLPPLFVSKKETEAKAKQGIDVTEIEYPEIDHDSFYEEGLVLLPTKPASKREHLVFLESNPYLEPDVYHYRPLFSNHKKEIPLPVERFVPPALIVPEDEKSDSKQPPEGVEPESAPAFKWTFKEVEDIERVSSDEQFRYLLLHLLRNIVPAAGRIVSVPAGGKEILVDFGDDLDVKRNIQNGDRMIALRQDSDGNTESLSASLLVQEAQGSFVKLSVSPNGMEAYWPDINDLQVNDIVCKPVLQRHLIGVLPMLNMRPNPDDPISRTIAGIKTDDRSRRELYDTLSRQTDHDGYVISNKIVSALTALGFEAVSPSKTPLQYWEENRPRNSFSSTSVKDGDMVAAIMVADLAKQGATHVIGGNLFASHGTEKIRRGKPPEISVSRYQLRIGVRQVKFSEHRFDPDQWMQNYDQNNQQTSSELLGVWDLSINQSQIND